jgi:hypothetical protein
MDKLKERLCKLEELLPHNASDNLLQEYGSVCCNWDNEKFSIITDIVRAKMVAHAVRVRHHYS